jgi:uncharacterized RmlC-like cupin family protein
VDRQIPGSGVLSGPDAAKLGVERCTLLDLPIVHDARGNLTFIEGGRHVGFEIARVYYLYDVPGGASRGGHAHRELEQLIIATSGSFEVVVDDGTDQRRIMLRRSHVGLYVPPMIWRDRVYYLYDVPGGAERGGHAHKTLHQLLIAMSGSFDVKLDDGRDSDRCHLNRPYRALYIPPMVWREMDNFSSGSVCLVLASAPFDESDYLRDYDAFRIAAAGR